ncbi:MAG: response regulator [Pseudomonadota bacterium]
MSGTGHILVIEDDELFATLMADTLQQEGYACTIAPTLGEARALLAAQRFDVIVTDIHLPDSADSPVLDMLTGQTGTATPLIVITGQPSLDSAMKSMNLRAFAYRTKPLAMGDLLITVHEAVREGNIRRRLGATRERLRTLDLQLEQLRQITLAPAPSNLNQSLAEYILLLLGNCGENLAEAVEAFQLMDVESLQRPVRQLSRHPDAEMFRRAIEHTIEVLEKTRHSFKSRELAELRQKLETALTVTRDG